jgi:hypothetical protein
MTERPASDERTAEIQRFAKGLTVYASHLGNCPYESWNKGMTKCKCGLFALLKQAEAVLKVKPTTRREADDDR